MIHVKVLPDSKFPIEVTTDAGQILMTTQEANSMIELLHYAILEIKGQQT